MKYLYVIAVVGTLLYLYACQNKESAPISTPSTEIPDEKQPIAYVKDPHSYADPENARITHLDWVAFCKF